MRTWFIKLIFKPDSYNDEEWEISPPSARTVLLITGKRKMNMTKWLLAGKKWVNAL